MQGSQISPTGSVAITRQGRLGSFAERNWRHLFELAFIVPAYIAYQFVRGAVRGQAGTAFENASRLIHIEKQLGIFHEAFLQQAILGKAWVVDAFNYLYIWGHLPVIIAVAVWLYVARRDRYALFRNAFLISGLIALIGFGTVPLAPPRYMPEFGFTDTIVHAQSYYAFQNPKIVNQYAAMPSLHFGWDLLVAIAIYYNARSRWMRVVAAIMPVAMLGGIVLTANHYFLDAAAGALVAMMGLGIAVMLRRTLGRGRRLRFLF
ncbi:MAG TPA: phosphatase PAP2 family protein [Dehalococcoidia bacterium]|nr:phosphatase PAP2 family protein [Dehalococcoidia bacterium]